jgi:hypothetical protein
VASDQLSVISFMKMLVTAFLIVTFCRLSVAEQERVWDVDRLCGRVEHVQRIPDRKLANTFSEQRRGLRDLQIALFQRRDGQHCCDARLAIETTRTGRGGRFEFKTKNTGNFWLTTNWNSKEYKIAVVNKQQKDSPAMCSNQGIALDDSGSAGWWVTITVD